MKPELSKKTSAQLLGAFAFNALAYYGGRAISHNAEHYCLSTPWDAEIPLLSWTILIYLGCYLFWAVTYYLSIRYDKGHGYRFFGAHIIGEGICFLCFVFFPTSMVRPEITARISLGCLPFRLNIAKLFGAKFAKVLLPQKPAYFGCLHMCFYPSNSEVEHRSDIQGPLGDTE